MTMNDEHIYLDIIYTHTVNNPNVIEETGHPTVEVNLRLSVERLLIIVT